MFLVWTLKKKRKILIQSGPKFHSNSMKRRKQEIPKQRAKKSGSSRAVWWTILVKMVPLGLQLFSKRLLLLGLILYPILSSLRAWWPVSKLGDLWRTKLYTTGSSLEPTLTKMLPKRMHLSQKKKRRNSRALSNHQFKRMMRGLLV